MLKILTQNIPSSSRQPMFKCQLMGYTGLIWKAEFFVQRVASASAHLSNHSYSSPLQTSSMLCAVSFQQERPGPNSKHSTFVKSRANCTACFLSHIVVYMYPTYGAANRRNWWSQQPCSRAFRVLSECVLIYTFRLDARMPLAS